MDAKEKVQICKVVAQAILADGQLTDAERQFLGELMDKFELNDAEKKDVMARNIGDDPGELARDITDPEAKNTLLVELAMAIASDGEFSSSERALIISVSSAMDVNLAELDMLIKTALM